MPWVVCVLEDDADMREVLSEVLEQDDLYAVHTAASPGRALELAGKMQLDLVVADVRMAEMDGIQCLSTLRQGQPHLRSIVMTGYASEDAPGRAIAVEAEDYLYKPFRLAEFLTCVRQVLETKKQQAMYAGLLSAYRVSRNRPAPPNSTEAWRERVFRSFYVGVRSGWLGQNAALEAWDRLERLESSPDDFSGSGAVGTYQSLLDLVLAPEKLISSPYRPDRVTSSDFAPFFTRVKEGKIPPELIKLGPLLRKLDAVSLREFPDLGALHAQTWGQRE